MKNFNWLFLMLSFFSLIILLSGCTNASALQTLTINNEKGYEGVLVSESYSLVETTGYEEVLVNGEDKAEELISILNGTELTQVSEKEIQERAKQFEEPGNYRFLLYNKPSVNSSDGDIYPFLFYKDGTIQVSQEGISYFIVDPPKDLLTQLKKEWDITF